MKEGEKLGRWEGENGRAERVAHSINAEDRAQRYHNFRHFRQFRAF